MRFDVDKMINEVLAMPITPEDIAAAESEATPKRREKVSPRVARLRSIVAAKMIADTTKCELKSIDDFPAYVPEEDNRDILIKGRWLERGGSAWWISTAGTGKSISAIQLAFLMSVGLPFAGLYPNVKEGEGLSFWVIQSEDSPSRVTIDREDITAELMEQYPAIDWKEARKAVKFLTIGGKVGADFLEQLTAVLTIAKERNSLPDVIIINPFLAYIGGPITDGAYVTPFLRGGEINRKATHGLQHLLEKFDIGALIYHHTPKPPSEDEIDKWMKSTFPEYQGAGSSDITNWGRSFVTMMRVKGEVGMVCITAGKNGGELGWDIVDGAPRHYLAWSRGKGITGKGRHAWRELDDEEYARVTKESKSDEENAINTIVTALRDHPMTAVAVEERMTACGMRRRAFRTAWKTVASDYKAYDLVCIPARNGRAQCWIFGEYEAAKRMAFEYETGVQNG